MSDLAIAGMSSLTAGDEEQLVTMTVDSQLFGIPILRVQDIVEPVQITPVPLASSAVAGVLNLRGRIVTVIDLRVCLGAEPKDLSERPMSVTVEHKGDLYTVLVDSIGDVRSLPRRDLDKPPQTLDPRMRKLCSGVFRLQDDLLAVLDVERVLDPATIAEAPRRRPLKRSKEEKPAMAPRKKKEATKKASNDDNDKEAAPASAKPTSSSSSEAQATVFEQLGGELGIDAAVDLFYEKASGDPRLAEILEVSNADALARQTKAFMTQALGGSSSFNSADLAAAHQQLAQHVEVDDGHFIAACGLLADTLNQMGVPAELIDEVLGVVDGRRDEILGR